MLDNVTVFSLSSSKKLTAEIVNILGIKEGKISVTHFADGEILIEPGESVRGKHVFIVQSSSLWTPSREPAVGKLPASFRISAMPDRTARPSRDSRSPPVWLPTCYRLPVRTVSSPSTCTLLRFRASSRSLTIT